MNIAKILVPGLLLSSLTLHAMESDTKTIKNYRPLIVINNNPFIEFSSRADNDNKQHAAKNGSLYVLHKTKDNSIDTQELIIKRYAGSAVFKNPFFYPPKGFRSITGEFKKDKNFESVPSLIQQYCAFIAKKHDELNSNSGTWFAQLFFYADAEALAAQNKNWSHKLASYLNKKQQEKAAHPLVTKLQEAKTMLGTEEYITDKENEAFAYTNIFVDDELTLEELKKQLNPNIKLVGNTLYLYDADGIANEYTVFEPWQLKG